MPALTIRGAWFVDSAGRRVLLRGVNLGGSSKLPTRPDGATHHPTDFAAHRDVSFVGRPFAPEEADEHLSRLRHWGFNCLRLLTTWEAVEHAGPGRYDEAYLDALREVVKKAGRHDLFVFIDPHQDVWSRMTGGDGAPGWTLELAGFEIGRLDAAEAAITMQRRYPDYGTMVWPNSGSRLACATLFTLFFAGERLAPSCRVEGLNIQHYLQEHFIGAMQQVAERLADLPQVIGYGSLNEPGQGYVGLAGLRSPMPQDTGGPRLTGLESMAVGSGVPVQAPLVALTPGGWERTGVTTLNPEGISAWKDDASDVWRAHGVWDRDAGGRPVALRNDYFAGLDLFRDGLRPFANRFITGIRRVAPDALLFLEGNPDATEPLCWDPAGGDASGVVNASHWYDLCTLTTKRYDPDDPVAWERDGTPVRGKAEVRALYTQQIRAVKEMSRRHMGGPPTLIGEFGVPFDMNGGTAYRTGDFREQEEALDACYAALDANLVHGTLWNYTADNTNRWGDGWNQEDLSIFSRDQQQDPHRPDSGGRAVAGFCRPYVRRCAGEPERMAFHRQSGEFLLQIRCEACAAPTEVYVPRFHYPRGIRTETTSGRAVHDPEAQVLRWEGASPGFQRLRIHPG